MMDKKLQDPEMTYERAITRLEEIVTILEKGKQTLDESVKLFEEGARLSAFCDRALQDAQMRILTLEEVKEQNKD